MDWPDDYYDRLLDAPDAAGDPYDPTLECEGCGETIYQGTDGTRILVECPTCLNGEPEDD